MDRPAALLLPQIAKRSYPIFLNSPLISADFGAALHASS